MSALPTLERTTDTVPNSELAGSPAVAEPASERSAGWGIDAVLTAVFALFGWVAGTGRLGDNSFFWHLHTGEWILDHGAVPRHDVFSYTAPGSKWVAQSWLAEVAYGAVNRSVGAFGIRVLVGAVGVSVAVLAYRLALRLCRGPWRAAGVTAAALVCVFALWSERPLVFGLVLFLVLLWVVEVPTSWVGRHAVVVIPIVMWLWANVHGSFALGFAYLGLHVIGRWLEGTRPWDGQSRPVLFGALIGFAVSFANPYGLDIVLFPVQLLSRGDILSHVIEWQSPDFRTTFGIAFALWICVFVAALARGRHRAGIRDLVVTIPMLLLALWALRNVAVAPLVGLPVVARAIAVDHVSPSRFSRQFVAGATAVLVLVALAIGAAAAGEPDFALESYPARPMQYLARHDLIGRHLLTDDADAGFVILQYAPSQRVFMDDRFDMYPRSVIYGFLHLADGDGRSLAILDRYGVDTVVWRRGAALPGLLAASGSWERVYRDKTYVIYLR